MMTRHKHWFVLAWVISTLTVGNSASAISPKAPPHVVILLADDLGWADTGFNGSDISTPHLDRLAASGVRMNQFYVSPVCTPTRAALMTGRYPIRMGLQCGVIRPWAMHGLPLDERTLPEALKEAGYTTAIVGKWHLGHNDRSYLPTNRGFDYQYGHYNGAIDYFKLSRDGGHDWHKNDRRSDDKGYATELTAREAVSIIEKHDPKTPLFLYVPFSAPHTPLQAPLKYIDQYSSITDKKKRVYSAMVSAMDDAIGKILTQLEKSDYNKDNTLIIFASDNGALSVIGIGSNGNLRGTKGRLYEGGVRSPTVISFGKNLEAGTIHREMVHISDLYPTILNLAGANLDQEKPLDGKDLWPTLVEGKPSPHETILHNVNAYTGAVRVDDWKLVWNGHVSANQTQAPKHEKWELFNLAQDPLEKISLADQEPRVFARLKAKMQTFKKEAVDPTIPPNTRPDGFKVPEVWGE
ncbi:MAG: arylsulfatase [Akkermansiaceae bacterium]